MGAGPAAQPAAGGPAGRPADPALPAERKTGLLTRLLADKAQPVTLQLVQTAVQDRLAAPGDAPQDVAAIVRAELARTDAQARDQKLHEDVETHAQILAKLQEDPPRAPVTRRHRFMGWGS